MISSIIELNLVDFILSDAMVNSFRVSDDNFSDKNNEAAAAELEKSESSTDEKFDKSTDEKFEGSGGWKSE